MHSQLKSETFVVLAMDHNLDLLKHQKHSKMQCFLEINLEANLLPTIRKPTCVTTSSATLIDNIFARTSTPESIKSGVIIDNTSDHFPIITEIMDPNVTQCEPQKYVMRKLGDPEIEQIKTTLEEINWDDRLKEKGGNDSFNDFHDILQQTIDRISPETYKIQKIKRNVPWPISTMKMMSIGSFCTVSAIFTSVF